MNAATETGLITEWKGVAAWLRDECPVFGVRFSNANIWWEDGAHPLGVPSPYSGVLRIRLGDREFAGVISPGEVYHLEKIPPAAIDIRLRWRATDLLVNAIRTCLMDAVVRLPS